MTVSEVIELLKQMPMEANVSVNAENAGTFYEHVNDVFYSKGNEEYDDEPCAVIIVGEKE